MRLRAVMVEGGIRANTAAQVAAGMDIHVPDEAEAEAKEALWSLVDNLGRLAVLAWKTLEEDVGTADAETLFTGWGKRMNLKFG